MKTLLYTVILIILAHAVLAADPLPADMRQSDVGRVIEEQNEKWQAYIEARDVAIDKQINDAYNEWQTETTGTIRKVVFILPLLIFCCILAALEMHDLLKRRRERAYNSVLAKNAERASRSLEYAEKQRRGMDELLG